LNKLINFNIDELEKLIWNAALETFQQTMVEILSMLDANLMAKRDKDRFEYKDIRKRNYVTMVGEITVSRRYYWDNQEKEWVFLLDKALGFDTEGKISGCLKELVVLWATKGTSYRDAESRLIDLYGHQVISHEKIRQVLIQASRALEKTFKEKPVKRRVKTLFIEADGFWTGVQGKELKISARKKRKRETYLVVVHEGWEIRQGLGKKTDYRLKNPMYITVLAGSEEDVWEQTWLRLLERYENLGQTQFVINGDFAPWIRAGTNYFRNSIYQYDRFHLKREVRQMLSKNKEFIGPALSQIEQNNPDGLCETIDRAIKRTSCSERKMDLLKFKNRLGSHKDALIDYRRRLGEQGKEILPTWRGMGAAESNVDRFKLRTAKRGRSWSAKGLKAILHMLRLLYENTLHSSIKELDISLKTDSEELITTSAHQIAQTVGKEAIGVQQGTFPAIARGTQGYAKLFRSILDPSPI